jgi:hypothetical protein
LQNSIFCAEFCILDTEFSLDQNFFNPHTTHKQGRKNKLADDCRCLYLNPRNSENCTHKEENYPEKRRKRRVTRFFFLQPASQTNKESKKTAPPVQLVICPLEALLETPETPESLAQHTTPLQQ